MRVALHGLRRASCRGAQPTRGDDGRAAGAGSHRARRRSAEPDPPLVTAIAFASAASDVPRQVATLDPGRRPLLSLLPKQVHIVDGYQYDFEDYVGLKQPRDLVDSDRVATFDILRRPRRGWMAHLAYDTEYRGPVTGRSDVLRIEFRHRW
jgi:hypothetical protein